MNDTNINVIVDGGGKSAPRVIVTDWQPPARRKSTRRVDNDMKKNAIREIYNAMAYHGLDLDDKSMEALLNARDMIDGLINNGGFHEAQ